MRFYELMCKRSVPEWSRCYYDYEYSKKLILLGKRAFILLQKINLCVSSSTAFEMNGEQSRLNMNLGIIQPSEVIEMLVHANKIFFKFHNFNRIISFSFCLMKVHQLNDRLDIYEDWASKVQTSKEQFYKLLYNVFYQGKLLERMCQINLMAYQKVLKKHRKVFRQVSLDTPSATKLRLDRIKNQLKNYFHRLEVIYLRTKQVYPKRARTELYQELESNPLYQSIASYFFGMSNGISLCLIIVIVVIITHSGLDLTNDRFRIDFPVWRGMSFFIIYIWALATNIVVLEKYRINYQLVFRFQKITPKAAFALAAASGLTLLYLFLYIFYIFSLSQIIYIDPVSRSYFPLVIIGLIIIYLVCPLPIFNHRGRLFLFKILLQTILSPITGVHFYIIWTTEQFISMIVPASDLFYTICYYAGENSLEPESCSSLLVSGQIFGIIIFSYRLLQSLRVAYENQKFLGTMEMFLVVRCVLNIFLLLVSYFSGSFDRMILVWVIFIWPILLYNYYVDLKYDWGLLEFGIRNPYLREFLAFHNYQYYLIMAANLIFRAGWIITLSSHIIFALEYRPYLLMYGAAMLQISRRLVWNIIRIQKEHVCNCKNFTAKTDYHQNEEEIKKELDQEQPELFDPLASKKHTEFLALIKSFMDSREVMRNQIDQFEKQCKEKMASILKAIEQLSDLARA